MGEISVSINHWNVVSNIAS